VEDKFAGKFIVLDGPDGCGKSTQTKLLVEWLGKQDAPTIFFCDPVTKVIGEITRVFFSLNFIFNINAGNHKWITLWLLKV